MRSLSVTSFDFTGESGWDKKKLRTPGRAGKGFDQRRQLGMKGEGGLANRQAFGLVTRDRGTNERKKKQNRDLGGNSKGERERKHKRVHRVKFFDVSSPQSIGKKQECLTKDRAQQKEMRLEHQGRQIAKDVRWTISYAQAGRERNQKKKQEIKTLYA